MPRTIATQAWLKQTTGYPTTPAARATRRLMVWILPLRRATKGTASDAAPRGMPPKIRLSGNQSTRSSAALMGETNVNNPKIEHEYHAGKDELKISVRSG
jgi:hypothetical protein